MTSPEPFDEGQRVCSELGRLDAALATGRVTADDAGDRMLESFALALRAAAPRPRQAFTELLDRRMREEFARGLETPSGHPDIHAPLTSAQDRTRPDDKQPKIRVLVAHHDALVRKGAIGALEWYAGIEVIAEADNDLTAMDLARQLRPDVMVLDGRMPGLGGAVMLERLRAELPEIRALVMTANESPESLLDAVAAGAAGYLSERTTAEDLCQAIITTYGGGAVITPELAGHLLRQFSGSARGEGSSMRPLLAARELEILRLVADGLTDHEIAKQLSISARTAQTYLTRIPERTARRRRPWFARWSAAFRAGGGGRAR